MKAARTSMDDGAAREGSRERKGLGLYIARRMAKAHGGALEVDSSPDGGMTFSIRLRGFRRTSPATGQRTPRRA